MRYLVLFFLLFTLVVESSFGQQLIYQNNCHSSKKVYVILYAHFNQVFKQRRYQSTLSGKGEYLDSVYEFASSLISQNKIGDVALEGNAADSLNFNDWALLRYQLSGMTTKAPIDKLIAHHYKEGLLLNFWGAESLRGSRLVDSLSNEYDRILKLEGQGKTQKAAIRSLLDKLAQGVDEASIIREPGMVARLSGYPYKKVLFLVGEDHGSGIIKIYKESGCPFSLFVFNMPP